MITQRNGGGWYSGGSFSHKIYHFPYPYPSLRKLEGVVAELEPLSKKYALFNSFSDVDKARALAGFIQELTSAITDYQVRESSGPAVVFNERPARFR